MSENLIQTRIEIRKSTVNGEPIGYAWDVFVTVGHGWKLRASGGTSSVKTAIEAARSAEARIFEIDTLDNLGTW